MVLSAENLQFIDFQNINKKMGKTMNIGFISKSQEIKI